MPQALRRCGRRAETANRIARIDRRLKAEKQRRRYHADIKAARKRHREQKKRQYQSSPEVRVKAAAYAKRKYDRRRAAGLCNECGEETSGNTLCTRCRDRQNETKRARYHTKRKKIIDAMYTAQKCRCAGCGHPTRKFAMELDHIVPRSKGGSDAPSNRQLLCRYCNNVKGDRSMDYLLAKIAAHPEIWRDHQLRLGRYKDIPA